MDTTPPAAPTNVAVSPATLASGTWTTGGTNVIVSGTLGENNISMRFYDLTTLTELGSATVTGTNFVAPLALGVTGNHQIQVATIDKAGNETDTTLNIFVGSSGPTGPAAVITPVVPNVGSSPVGSVTITFSEPVSGFTLADLQLTRNGGANLLTGSQTLSSSDNQTWTLSNLAGITTTAGTYTLTLAPTGISDSSDNPMLSGTSTSFTITAASAAKTSIAVSASANPIVVGQSVTLSAVITASSGTPTGTINFEAYSNGQVLGTGTLAVVNGQDVATATLSNLAVAGHSIIAVFAGNTNFLADTSSPYSLTVDPASTTTALTESLSSSVYSQPVKLTATVAVVSPGAGTPTGPVTFMDGSTVLGTGGLYVANGQDIAVLNVSTLPPGSNSLTAVYSGTSSYITSTSTALSEPVSQDSTKITTSVSTGTAVYGQPVTFTAVVTRGQPGHRRSDRHCHIQSPHRRRRAGHRHAGGHQWPGRRHVHHHQPDPRRPPSGCGL